MAWVDPASLCVDSISESTGGCTCPTHNPTHPDHPRPWPPLTSVTYPEQRQQCPRSHLAGPRMRHCSFSSSCCGPPSTYSHPGLAPGPQRSLLLRGRAVFRVCAQGLACALQELKALPAPPRACHIPGCCPKHGLSVCATRGTPMMCVHQRSGIHLQTPPCMRSRCGSSGDGRRAWWLCMCAGLLL